MGNRESKVPQIEDTLAALVERGKRTTNIGEKITIVLALIDELKKFPIYLFDEDTRVKFVKMNKDMYSFLHSIKDYVAEYESEYQILADFQKEWSPEECKEKTREYLLVEIDGEPSLLARIVASTKEFQKKLGELLIDIREFEKQSEKKISTISWILFGASMLLLVCGIVSIIVPCLIPLTLGLTIGLIAAGGAGILIGVGCGAKNFSDGRAIEEFQKELQDSTDLYTETLLELDPLISEHDNAVKVLDGIEKRGGDFKLANAAKMCETFKSLHAAFRTAVGEKATVSTDSAVVKDIHDQAPIDGFVDIPVN